MSYILWPIYISKWLFKVEHSKIIFWISKISSTTISKLWVFSNVDAYHRLSSFQFFPHQMFFIKRVFSIVLLYKKIGVKIQKSFTKTKIQFIKLNDLKKNLQHSCKSFNTNFFDQHILKWHYINMFDKMIIFRSWNMVFNSFNYDSPNTFTNAFKNFIIIKMLGIKLKVPYGLHFIGPNYSSYKFPYSYQ